MNTITTFIVLKDYSSKWNVNLFKGEIYRYNKETNSEFPVWSAIHKSYIYWMLGPYQIEELLSLKVILDISHTASFSKQG